MLVSIKLALYLYAAVRLLGGRGNKKENNAVGLDRFPCYFLCSRTFNHRGRPPLIHEQDKNSKQCKQP